MQDPVSAPPRPVSTMKDDLWFLGTDDSIALGALVVFWLGVMVGMYCAEQAMKGGM